MNLSLTVPTPKKQIPDGHYWSKMCGMALRKRIVGQDITPERHTLSPRALLRNVLSETSTAPDDAMEGRKLASEDATRYGAALWSGKIKDYLAWRASQGLSWWHEQERLYPVASNDNIVARKAA